MAEVIRATCKNNACAHNGDVHEYGEGYRQHTAFKCGECGSEMFGELTDGSVDLDSLPVVKARKIRDVLKKKGPI